MSGLHHSAGKTVSGPLLPSGSSFSVSLNTEASFANFLQDYRKVVSPSYQFDVHSRAWSEEVEAAFRCLKSLFTPAPILSHRDPSHQFIMELDASIIGVSAFLSLWDPKDQRLHTCVLFNRRLALAEVNYHVGNQELLAVVLAWWGWGGWGLMWRLINGAAEVTAGSAAGQLVQNSNSILLARPKGVAVLNGPSSPNEFSTACTVWHILDVRWLVPGWLGGTSLCCRRRPLRGKYCHNSVLGDVQITTAQLSHTCTSCFREGVGGLVTPGQRGR